MDNKEIIEMIKRNSNYLEEETLQSMILRIYNESVNFKFKFSFFLYLR